MEISPPIHDECQDDIADALSDINYSGSDNEQAIQEPELVSDCTVVTRDHFAMFTAKGNDGQVITDFATNTAYKMGKGLSAINEIKDSLILSVYYLDGRYIVLVQWNTRSPPISFLTGYYRTYFGLI